MSEESNRQLPADINFVEAARKTSKVSGDGKEKKSFFIWLIIFTVGLMAVSLFFKHQSDKTVVRNDRSNDQAYRSNLAANQKQLNALTNSKPDALADDRLVNPMTPEHHTEIDKAYIARQHAPTDMYSAVSPNSSDKTSSTKKVFAEESRNAGFANRSSHVITVLADKIEHPIYTIVSGELIHAVLETAVHSDLPGMVRAVISQPAHGYLGSKVLIPSGSRLIGQYTSNVIQGQNRVMIMWNRIILPDGISMSINSPSSDVLGRAGQGADQVNRHFLARFGEASLLSLLGAGVANVGVNGGDEYNSADAYRLAIAESFQQSAQQSLQGSLPQGPTLHIHQGTQINVFVVEDLDFYSVLGDK